MSDKLHYIYNHMLVQSTYSLKEILKKIDFNGKGIVFVVDENSQMIGTVTDGDIRRLLLKDYGLNEIIYKHLKKDFEFAYANEDIEEVYKKLSFKIQVLPILNKNYEIVDYYDHRDDVFIPIMQPNLKGDEFKYLQNAFLSTWISSTGEYITKFEEMFSNYCGVNHGVAVSNGTCAIHLALLALDIGEGDEVIIPDLTFAATINAVIHANATPVIVDVEEYSWCIDPFEIEKAITNKTKAIIPVHLYGQPCDMETIAKIAKEYNLYIIEDCAEAHGAEFDNKKVGSMSDISCFSFFGNKVITTGEGGMCLTNDKHLEERIRLFKDHGMDKSRKYYHTVVGYNYRMTNLQAAIGVGQLERINEIHTIGQKLEQKYFEKLSDNKFVTLQSTSLDKRKKIAWLISILIDETFKEKCFKKFKENNIDVRPFFVPLSQMDIYKKYSFGENVVSLKLSKKGMNLPSSHDVSDETIDKIIDIINESIG